MKRLIDWQEYSMTFAGAPATPQNKTGRVGRLSVVIAVDAYFKARIQFTSRRALPSVMATELGGIDRPLTLSFQWLL